MPGHNLLAQVLLSAMVVFLFAVSLLGLALGLALMLRNSVAQPFMALMNRWVSMRKALRPLEAQVSLPAAVGARWFGLILVASGAYAAVVLVGSFDVERLALLFKVDPRYSLASVGLATLKWLLVAGSAAAVIVGLMLLLFPQAWRGLEERANRWYSTRNLELAGDTVYMSLDRMVETHPRVAGGVIFVLSLVAAIASGLLLFARR
jgi:hypothetical protein